MAAVNKPKRTSPASVEVLSQISELLYKPRKPSPLAMSAGVQKAVNCLKGHATPGELKTLRDVARELASAVELLMALERVGPLEYAAAIHQDKVVRAVITSARQPMPMVTPQSVREGNKFRARAAAISMASTKARIASGELISSSKLREGLGIGGQALKNAVKAHRLFAILGPSDEYFYPSFFADRRLDRGELEKVSVTLGELPATIKYAFFTTMSEQLGETPIEALRKGRVDVVLRAAAGVATR